MARKLKIPVYFAVPASARGALPKNIETTDRLIDFKHPDAKGAATSACASSSPSGRGSPSAWARAGSCRPATCS